MGTRSTQLDGFGDDFAWALLDAVPETVVIASAAGQIVFVNDRAEGLFRRAAGELIGLMVEELLPESLRSVHKADRTRYRAEPTVRPMGVGLDLRALRGDGTEVPVEISLSPMRLGGELYVLAGVRDISERLAAEDHLHRVMRTLDATDDGLFIFDAETLRYSFVNEGAVRLVGYSRDQLLEMTPLHINPSATEEQYRQIVARLREEPTKPVVRQTSLLSRDGLEVPVEKTYQSAATGIDGREWVIGLARDITDRLAAEVELKASRDALQAAEQVVAIADDRERIARDLHDSVIQRLFGEGLKLEAILPRVDEPLKARLESIVDGLDSTIKELRKAIFSLQGSGPLPGGLRGRLLEEVTTVTEGLGFEPRLQFAGPIESIDQRIADHLIPVLREALSNVARHAQADNVRVSVDVDDRVTLAVNDDGSGVPNEVIGGKGLVNMVERASTLGGSCTITRLPAGGTELVWSVPADLDGG